jgi:hypothetical protein
MRLIEGIPVARDYEIRLIHSPDGQHLAFALVQYLRVDQELL